jgi:hypothetical protein
VLHRKYGRLFLLHKPFKFFVFASQTLQVFRLALRKKAEYVVVSSTFLLELCELVDCIEIVLGAFDAYKKA